MFDLLITGGTVVMPSEAAAVDIGVQDGRIVAIGAPGTLSDEAARTVDASGADCYAGGGLSRIFTPRPMCSRGRISWWPASPTRGRWSIRWGRSGAARPRWLTLRRRRMRASWWAGFWISCRSGKGILMPTIRRISFTPAGIRRTALPGWGS